MSRADSRPRHLMSELWCSVDADVPQLRHEVSRSIPAARRAASRLRDDTEPCPHCRQPMPEDADVCPHCGGERCPTCGAALQPDTLTCANCGTTFVLNCPACHAEIPDGATKCPNCGEVFRRARRLAEGDHCPHCGAPAAREDGVCTACGLTFCPRCFAKTQEEDEICPKCHWNCTLTVPIAEIVVGDLARLPRLRSALRARSVRIASADLPRAGRVPELSQRPARREGADSHGRVSTN